MNDPQQKPAPRLGSQMDVHSLTEIEMIAGIPKPRTAMQVFRDIVLFFAAPFITIVYLALFPFIGLKLLMRSGQRTRHDHPGAA